MVIEKIYKKLFNFIKNIIIFFILFFIYLYRGLINLDIFVILKWPFFFILNFYEFRLLKKKKKRRLKKIIKNYYKYYKTLLNYNKLPKLKSKYFLINYFKLKIKFFFVQFYFIIINFYRLNFELIKNSRKKRKFLGILNFDFFSNLNLHFISRKKYIKPNFIIFYINYLKKEYLNSYYIKYRISWVENRIRDQRSIFWDRVENQKEKINDFFLNFYGFFIFNILHISSFMPFIFINLLIVYLTLISFRYIKYINEIFIQKLILNFENLKLKIKKRIDKKIKRFKKYSIKSFFKGLIGIFYNKYIRSDLEDEELPGTYLEELDNYEDKKKFTKFGNFFGKIYNSLGLWSGINKGIWKGFKKMK